MQRTAKKCLKLLIVLLPLITTSCVTKPKSELTLPPKPQRQEIKEPESVEDLAEIINYYEHLVEEWEQWGSDVERLVDLTK